VKKLILLLAIAAAAFGAGDVLQQLGVPSSEAAESVLNSFAYGSVPYGRVADAFRKATPAARAAMAEQVLVWTKAYVASPRFAKDYATWREQQKPAPPDAISVDEEMKQRRAKQAADMEESRKSIAAMPAEYRKAAEDALKEAAASIKAMDTPEYRKMERENLEAERKERQSEYENSLNEWKTKYPADPRALVKQRLREFLAATADVDYSAKLVQSGTRKRFANADYEAKSGDWKLAFRAGKETTEKARAFAAAWLKEL
jgi:hypothetical protein